MNDLASHNQTGDFLRRVRKHAIPRESMRVLAARAGISVGAWGMAERGYRDDGGRRRHVTPEPVTFAKMAWALRVPAGRLAGEGGHPEAANELEALVLERGDGTQDTRGDARRQDVPMLDSHGGGEDPSLLPYLRLIESELEVAGLRYGPGFKGADAFKAVYEAAVWDAHAFTRSQKVRTIAMMRRDASVARREVG